VTDTLARLQSALADRYRVERELGAGGMATVYLAHDLRHERDVAIKVLHPDLGAALGAERFVAEIRTTAALQHPHILPLLDSGAGGGLLYYVMPFVKGETLRARLDRERQLRIDDAVLVSREVSDALAYAHEQGIVHRDIKPENILLQGGHALVADFGIALAVQQAGGARMTQTGLSLGTPQYMAPEQAMGEKQVDARADVYALGAVTYEMLTGEPPFTGATVQAIVAKILTERPVAPTAVRDTVPAHVEAAVLAALAKNPADRLGDAREFREALTGARVISLERSTRAATPSASLTRTGAARVWQSVAAMLGVTTLIAGALALRGRRAAATPALRQFELQLPDSMAMATTGGHQFAIARNGSRAVFQVRDRGKLTLRVRDQHAIEDRELLVVDEGRVNRGLGTCPTISADGEWIAYHDQDGVYAGRSTGGVMRRVSDSARMPTITDRQEVLFVSTSDSRSLRIVPLSGGPPRVVARADTAKRQFQLSWPTALPGGTHALVVVNHFPGQRLDSLRLALVDLERGTLTEVDMPGTAPRALSDGWVIFGQPGGRLVAAPFDVGAARFTAPPVLLLDAVSQGGGGATAFGVADDGTLLYQAGDKRTEVTKVVRRTPAGVISEVAPEVNLTTPRISRDGRWLLGSSPERSGGVTLVDLTTGSREQLVARDEGGGAEWLPDGRRIVFRRSRADGATMLIARTVDHSRPDSVLVEGIPRSEGGGTVTVSVAPDGGVILHLNGGAGQLLRAPANRLSHPDTLVASRGALSTPAVSPDGRWVAYADNESGMTKVYLIARDGGPRVSVSVAQGVEPRWAPDGRSLFYRGDGVIVQATFDAAHTKVTARRDVMRDSYTRATVGGAYWDVHPDGSFFFATRNDRPSRVHAIPEWRALLTRNQK
jgi:serine/threonine-protein kinase